MLSSRVFTSSVNVACINQALLCTFHIKAQTTLLHLQTFSEGSFVMTRIRKGALKIRFLTSVSPKGDRGPCLKLFKGVKNKWSIKMGSGMIKECLHPRPH